MRSFKMLDLDKINSLANKLKKQRETKGLTLEQVRKQTRIHLNILKAFEEGNFSILSPAYIRGFLKRYSEFLGLSAREILDEYAKNYPQSSEQVLFLEKEKQKGRISPKKFPKFIKPAGIAVLSLITIVFLGYVGIRFISLIQSNLRKPHKVARAVQKKTQPKPLQETERLIIPKNKPIILTLKATGDSWLQVKVDGNIFFSGFLKKGDKETWQATDKIELVVGKPENLEAELDQKSLGKLSKSSSRNVVITREGIKVKR